MVRFIPGNLLYLSPFHFYSLSRFHSLFVRSLFNHAPVEDPRLFLDSVRKQCRLGFSRVDVPVSIFHQLNSLRPRPSIIVFNQLFTAMSKIKPNPPFFTVITLFNQLELSGHRPDMHSIGVLAKCYCGLGRVDFGFSLLGKYLKLGYPPYNIQIKVLCRQGLLGDATNILKEMAGKGCSPDERTYNTIIKGCLGANDIAMALDNLHTMTSDGFAADADTASLFLSLLTSPNVGDADKALLKKYFLENNGMFSQAFLVHQGSRRKGLEM